VHPDEVVAFSHTRAVLADRVHDHAVPIVRLIALPAPTLRAGHLIHGFITVPVDLTKPAFSNLSISFLFALPWEFPPPLLARADHPDSGRSPPAVS